MSEIHSCSYYCDRPECIKAQRDELRDKIAPMPEPVGYGNADNIKCAARDGVPIVAWLHPGQSLKDGEWTQFDVPLYTVPPDQSARIAELEALLKRDDPVMFKAMQQDDEERAMLRERVAELEAQIREMVDKAAARSLDGYRELGRRAAQAEERAEKAEAERIFWKGRTLELEGKLNNVEAELAEARKVLAFVRPYVYGIDNIKRIDAALAKECGT